MNNNNKCVDLLTYGKDDSQKKGQRIVMSIDVFWRLIIASCIYTLISEILMILSNHVNINSMLVSFITITAYVVLLFSFSHIIHKRKMSYKEILSDDEIVAIFCFSLLINFLFLMISCVKDSDSIAGTMSLTNLSLYIGFAVSLNKLLEAKSFDGKLKCFIDPFCKINMQKKDWIKLCLISALFVFLVALLDTIIGIAVILVLILIFFFSCLIAEKKRKKKIYNFLHKLFNAIDNKRAMILQVGNNPIIIKHLIKEFGDNVVNDVEENDIVNQKYDVIVILDFTQNTENKKIFLLDFFSKFKDKPGIIIDPFMCNKKRNFIASWFGTPISFDIYNSSGEYISNI